MRFWKKTVIKRHDKEPYLIRWTIFSCSLFSIKIHNILLSDYDCHHDHPWSFISLILWGGYVEHTEKKSIVPTGRTLLSNPPQPETKEITVKKSRIYHPGNILYRKAEFAHKLELHQPCWTMVITFKKVRKWGFLTPKGWIEWFKYHPVSGCD